MIPAREVVRRESGNASMALQEINPPNYSVLIFSYAPIHHYFPCTWRRKNLLQTHSCIFNPHQVLCACAPKRSQQDHILIQCAKRHRRQLVQTDKFAPPETEMYVATSGTFFIAGYEVCQVSPCRIKSSLSDQRKEEQLAESIENNTGNWSKV